MIKIYRFLFRYQDGTWMRKLFVLLLANLALALVTSHRTDNPDWYDKMEIL